MGDGFCKLCLSKNKFVLPSQVFFFFFFTGFVECNVTGGKLFSFRIVRTLFHGQVSTSLKLFGSLESLCMISFLSSPPPPEVCGIFFYPWESYQAPSPQQ